MRTHFAESMDLPRVSHMRTKASWIVSGSGSSHRNWEIITMASKKEKMFRISGRVLNRNTGQGIAGLRIEAWDKDLIFNDLVGSSTTDAQGAFQIEFGRSYFKELFLDRHPDLFFKVFQGDALVTSTEDRILWNTEVGNAEIVIEVDMLPDAGANDDSEQTPQAVRPFVVRGQVRHSEGSILAAKIVRAYDCDLRAEELLGERKTDPHGRYEIQYSPNQFSRA